MKIVLVSTWYYPLLRGGAEHTIQFLAEGLARAGHEVYVYSLHSGSQREMFMHNGVKCVVLPPKNIRRFLRIDSRASPLVRAVWHAIDIYNPLAGRQIKAEIESIKPDIVQFHNIPGWSSAAWGAIDSLGIPVVQVLHDFHFTCPSATRFRNGANCTKTCMQCKLFEVVRRSTSRRVKNVVANSNYTKQVHQQLGIFRKAVRFEVIYGAVPVEAVARAQVKGTNLILGYYGRLHETKGLELVFDAFRRTQRSDLVLKVAGTGLSEYEQILRQKSEGIAVEFVGYRKASEFLPELDALIVPSIWNEPMGRVVIEAAAYGVPVFGAKRGGIPELIIPGKTGYLFDPSSIDEICSLLKAATRDDLERMRSDCLKWGMTFSPQCIIDRWCKLYNEILADKVR